MLPASVREDDGSLRRSSAPVRLVDPGGPAQGGPALGVVGTRVGGAIHAAFREPAGWQRDPASTPKNGKKIRDKSNQVAAQSFEVKAHFGLFFVSVAWGV